MRSEKGEKLIREELILLIVGAREKLMIAIQGRGAVEMK